MAEVFFKKFTENKFNVISAGTIPSAKLNPIVVEVMKEIGIDITEQSPKALTDSIISDSFRTINIGCMDEESCTPLCVKDVIDWNIPDPKEKTIEWVREIRDQIKSKVLNLIASINMKNNGLF
jgi:protein-tyrosine-phosphatase